MKIGFFEEFPTPENLAKLKLISFKTNLSLASSNVNTFLGLKGKIGKEFKNIEKIIYWPILNIKEGYWLSAFSNTEAIQRILKEIKSTKEYFPVLWDAELPILNKKLFLTEFSKVISNKKLIQNIISDQFPNHPLIITEIPRTGIAKILSEIAAVSFPFTNYHRLDMLYNSKNLHLIIRKNKTQYKNYSVALGLIAPGVNDKTESLISPQKLFNDLQVAKSEGVSEVIIYRLGGLNEEYLEVIKNFTN